VSTAVKVCLMRVYNERIKYNVWMGDHREQMYWENLPKKEKLWRCFINRLPKHSFPDLSILELLILVQSLEDLDEHMEWKDIEKRKEERYDSKAIERRSNRESISGTS